MPIIQKLLTLSCHCDIFNLTQKFFSIIWNDSRQKQNADEILYLWISYCEVQNFLIENLENLWQRTQTEIDDCDRFIFKSKHIAFGIITVCNRFQMSVNLDNLDIGYKNQQLHTKSLHSAHERGVV